MRKIMLLAALLSLAQASFGDSNVNDPSGARFSNSWGSPQEMQALNRQLIEQNERDRLAQDKFFRSLQQAAPEAGGETGGMEEQKAPPQKSAEEAPAYQSSAGNKRNYPIPCNEDDGLYVVDFQNFPPCDMSYPSGDRKAAEIQYLQPLSRQESAERARRPHLMFFPAQIVRNPPPSN